MYPAIVEEGRVLLSRASANDRPAFALNIAASTSQGGQRLLMITTCGNKTAPVNECHFALINGSFKIIRTDILRVAKAYLLLLLPLNGQHHYVDDSHSVVRRLSRAGNLWVRDRDHHSPQQVTHLPPVWDLLLPLA